MEDKRIRKPEKKENWKNNHIRILTTSGWDFDTNTVSLSKPANGRYTCAPARKAGHSVGDLGGGRDNYGSFCIFLENERE
jgi:hypothetical protein